MNLPNGPKGSKRCYSGDYQLAVAAGLLFAVLPIAMIWDISIAWSCDLQQLPGDIRKLVTISEAFSHGFGAAIILIIALILTDQPKQNLFRPIAGVILSGITANVSKLVLLRYRPHYFFERATEFSGQESPIVQQAAVSGWESIAKDNPSTFSGILPVLWNDHWHNSQLQSFPSAHSAIALSLALGLSHVFPKGRFVFLGLALLAGLQRIASHAHWPSDVVGGFLVGLIVSTMVGVRFRSTADAKDC